MAVQSVVTIGVYGRTGEEFLADLNEAHVDLLIDVRDRRGVRGKEYTWANKIALIDLLTNAGIAYRHERGLATPMSLRKLQYAFDEKQHVGQRHRHLLSPAFRAAYGEQVLDRFDMKAMLDSLPAEAKTIALFCVEADPEACHRSLAAGELHREFGLPVRHL